MNPRYVIVLWKARADSQNLLLLGMFAKIRSRGTLLECGGDSKTALYSVSKPRILGDLHVGATISNPSVCNFSVTSVGSRLEAIVR